MLADVRVAFRRGAETCQHALQSKERSPPYRRYRDFVSRCLVYLRWAAENSKIDSHEFFREPRLWFRFRRKWLA
jgi:hypothetical protein